MKHHLHNNVVDCLDRILLRIVESVVRKGEKNYWADTNDTNGTSAPYTITYIEWISKLCIIRIPYIAARNTSRYCLLNNCINADWVNKYFPMMISSLVIKKEEKSFSE